MKCRERLQILRWLSCFVQLLILGIFHVSLGPTGDRIMSNSAEIRWQQRYKNFHRAVMLLSAACKQDEYSVLERAGLVQMFEFSFELAWNTLKDLLFYEGYGPKTPRETIRTAFTAGYLNEDEVETALDALDKRNLLSHSYDEASAEEAVQLIKHRYAPLMTALDVRLGEKQESR